MICAGVLRANTAAEVAGIVANFGGAGTVPILPRHHHGRPIGWLHAVMADGSDVWFLGNLDDHRDAAQRLSSGPVAISLEMVGVGVAAGPDEPGIVLPAAVIGLPDTYRGVISKGWTLTGVAILPVGDRPGRAGSAMWMVS